MPDSFTSLPIEAVLPELTQYLLSAPAVVLQAPPGAGKTTRVPLVLLTQPWVEQRRILMLEPRRLAARMAARYMAAQLQEAPGETVGYRTRLETRVSARTRIEVVTEGILIRMLQADPALEAYAAVVFDEFHERSLQADLGLTLLLESCQALRDDLRVVVMSATLASAPVAAWLGHALGLPASVPVVTSAGRSFPVSVRYAPPSIPNGATRSERERAREQQVVRVVRELVATESGSVLVFLPGAAEIRRVAQALQDLNNAQLSVHPLYGNLSPQQQDAAVAPAPAGKRKVVLATAIAETSLTIEGVRVVVDAGLARRATFDANSGMTRLITQRVSQAAAAQRSGRAGRLSPGIAVRLWTESEHTRLEAFTPPEIFEADLAAVVLELAQWGVRDPAQLAWLDAPPRAHWSQAVTLLTQLGLMTEQNQITAAGQAVLNVGLPPRLAHMVVVGRRLGQPQLVAALAALLSERDRLRSLHTVDLEPRVRMLIANAEGPLQPVRALMQRLLITNKTVPIDYSIIGRLLALAFPDRVAQRRAGNRGSYRLSNGRGAQLDSADPLSAEWIVAAELDGDARAARIYLAAAVTLEDIRAVLAHRISESDEVYWDEARGMVISVQRERLDQLVLTERPLAQVSAEQVQRALLGAVRRRGVDQLGWDAAAQQLRARIQRMHSLEPDQWPAVDDNSLLATLEQWLLPFLIECRHWRHVANVDVHAALRSLLDYSQWQRLQTELPAALQIPTGQSVAIDYTAEAMPVLAAKLQSLFGWERTPALASGRIGLVIHLLSPARRPLAVTSSLDTFWRDVYPEVRKEQRGRYPKHPWPEDPLSATPSRGTRKSGV